MVRRQAENNEITVGPKMRQSAGFFQEGRLWSVFGCGVNWPRNNCFCRQSHAPADEAMKIISSIVPSEQFARDA